jgi:hypothetical protein
VFSPVSGVRPQAA